MALSLDQVKQLYAARLAKLEPEILKPLARYTWSRDLPIVEDLDKVSNVIALRNIKGIAQGTTEMGGMSWIGEQANDLKGVDYEMSASAVRVFTAGREISTTSMEIERAMRTEDINLDTEKLEMVNDRFQQESQQVAYLGDTGLSFKGLLNNTSEIDNGTATSLASSATWDDYVQSIDGYFNQAYQRANQVIMPNTVLLAPSTYVKLFSIKAPDDNHFSLIDYIEKESLGRKVAGSMIVNQVKELAGIGASNKDRILLYTNSRDYVRFHIKPVWREKSYDKGLEFCHAYLWRLSEVQIRRPETLIYFDGI